MKQLAWIAVLVSVLGIIGCSSSYTIQVIDGLPKEVYLKFDKGADVKVGDIFVLYRMLPPPRGGSSHGAHGAGGPMNLKQEIGRVQVAQIVDELHASVKILSGVVQDGVTAEKLR